MRQSHIGTMSKVWAKSIRNGKTPLIQRASLMDLQRERDRLVAHHKRIDWDISRAMRRGRQVKLDALYTLRSDVVFRCDMVLHEIARRLDMREKSKA